MTKNNSQEKPKKKNVNLKPDKIKRIIKITKVK